MPNFNNLGNNSQENFINHTEKFSSFLTDARNINIREHNKSLFFLERLGVIEKGLGWSPKKKGRSIQQGAIDRQLRNTSALRNWLGSMENTEKEQGRDEADYFLRSEILTLLTLPKNYLFDYRNK